MKVLAFSGSLRAGSSNTTLLHAVAALAPMDWQFTYYNEIGELPHFSPDLDDDNALPSPPVETLRTAVSSADAVVICTPEYARGVPGSLKNALDWTVSSGDFYGKQTIAIAASPHPTGGQAALSSLLLTLRMMGAIVDEKAEISVPFIRSKLAADGAIIDEQLVEQISDALETLR